MPRPEVPRLLECKSCQHEWRAREPTTCPKCKSVEVLSRCGVKRPKGPCRNHSAYGQPRCFKHGARNQAIKAGERAGRTSGWSNRTFADGVLRAASNPELRDMTHDIAAVQVLLDEAIGRASAGEGGAVAWKRLERLIGALDRDAETNPAAIPGHVEKLKALVAEERLRSTALLDVDMFAHRRTEMLKAEAKIAADAGAMMQVRDIQIMVAVLVSTVWELVPRETALMIARRIAVQFPGTNTQAVLGERGEA